MKLPSFCVCNSFVTLSFVMIKMMFYAANIIAIFSNLDDCIFEKDILLYKIDILSVLDNFL